MFRDTTDYTPRAEPLSSNRQQKIERLFRDFGKGVGSYVLARVGDPELAEEITARVFLQVVRHYDQLRGSAVAWLWSIVRNELARHFRAPRVRQPLDESLLDTKLLPGDELERRELAALLQTGLAALDESERDLIGMKFFLRMGNRDIAAATGLTATNVGVRLFRALQRLRGLMISRAAVDPSVE
jgi:RNA polymerase sigma-70 factor (ECF subfamily)